MPSWKKVVISGSAADLASLTLDTPLAVAQGGTGATSLSGLEVGTATTANNIEAVANNSTNETTYPTFVDGATGTQGIETDTGLTYNPSTGLLSTATITTTGLATVGNITSTGTWTFDEYSSGTIGITTVQDSGTAFNDNDTSLMTAAAIADAIPGINAEKITVTDSNGNEKFPVVFHDEGGNKLLDDTGGLQYNPNAGTLHCKNINLTGTGSAAASFTSNAGVAFIFEGATADAYETSLRITDPTADQDIYLPNMGGYIPCLQAATTTLITSTPAELNILDGVTSTAAELNILDGVTSTAAELNILDGATVVVAEVNYNDLGGTGTGTAIASKTVVLNSLKHFTGANRTFAKTSTVDANYEGDVVYFGATTSMTAGAIYHYVPGAEATGEWTLADADAEATCDGLLAVALGAESDSSGMLLRGMVTIANDPGALADTLFVSTTAGQATSTAPSSAADIVRIIGYCLDTSNGQIWFNPDNAYIEIAAD